MRLIAPLKSAGGVLAAVCLPKFVHPLVPLPEAALATASQRLTSSYQCSTSFSTVVPSTLTHPHAGLHHRNSSTAVEAPSWSLASCSSAQQQRAYSRWPPPRHDSEPATSTGPHILGRGRQQCPTLESLAQQVVRGSVEEADRESKAKTQGRRRKPLYSKGGREAGDEGDYGDMLEPFLAFRQQLENSQLPSEIKRTVFRDSWDQMVLDVYQVGHAMP